MKPYINVVTFLIVIVILTLAQPAAAFGVFMSKDIKGTIVDADTGEPIEGVIVTASWMMLGWFDSHRSIGAINVSEAVTDLLGRYTLPGWGPKLSLMGYLNDDEPKIRFFKPGYVPLVIRNNSVYHPGLEKDTDHKIKEKVTLSNGRTGMRMYEPEGHQVNFGKKVHEFSLEPFEGTDEEYVEVLTGNFNVLDTYISSLNRLRSTEDCNWQKIPLTLIVLDRLGASLEANGMKYHGIPRISHIGDTDYCGSAEKYFKGYLR